MKKVFTRLTALIIVIGAVLSGCSKSPEAESPGSDGGAPETEAVIAGTIADITNASIAVETDGGVYLFERDDTLMHVDSGLLLTGPNSVGGFSQSGNTAGTSSGMETLRPAWD